MFILNAINEKKRVLNKERNNTYLAEASIFSHYTTTCDFDKYIIIINRAAMGRARFMFYPCFFFFFFNRAAMGQARFIIYPWFIFNRVAMGRARFIIYPWLIFFSLFSLRPDPDCHSAILKIGMTHATCYVYSPKAVETLLHGQYYEYVKYIFFSFYPFLFALDLKRIINTLKRY